MAQVATNGNELTASEELVVQAIAAGTYFVENIVPTGTVNGVNAVFTLPSTPNPATSVELRLNGAVQKAGGEDFTLSGLTITYVNPPVSGSVHTVTYRVSPV